jgi:hypothetical protein
MPSDSEEGLLACGNVAEPPRGVEPPDLRITREPLNDSIGPLQTTPGTPPPPPVAHSPPVDCDSRHEWCHAPPMRPDCHDTRGQAATDSVPDGHHVRTQGVQLPVTWWTLLSRSWVSTPAAATKSLSSWMTTRPCRTAVTQISQSTTDRL